MTDSRWKLLWIVILVALALRVLLFVGVSGHPERMIHPDSGSYVQPALELLAGGGLTVQQWLVSTVIGRRTPVYPMFVALLYAIGGQDPRVIAGAQALIGVLVVGLTCLLGLRLLSEREGLLGGLLLALSLGAIVYSMYILTETLFTLLLLGSILSLTAYGTTSQGRWLVIGGALMGVSVLCRPIAHYFVPIAGLVAALTRWGRWRQGLLSALVFLIVAGLVIVPWVARNYVVLGVPTLSTISAYNLLFYNAVSLESEMRNVEQAQVRAEMIERLEGELARRASTGDTASQTKLHSEWGRQIIASHPWRYLYVHLKTDLNSLLPSITEFWELLGITKGGRGTLSVLNQYGPWAAIRHYFGDQLWLVWVLLPLMILLGLTYVGAVAGVFVLAQQRAWLPLALLVLPVAYFLLIPGAPSHPRFRVPVMPYVCLLAGVGLRGLWGWVRRSLSMTILVHADDPDTDRRLATDDVPADSSQPATPVLHIITRLIIGGAQETAMLAAELLDKSLWKVVVLSGPQTGPEGSLIEEVRARGILLIIEPTLVREIRPIKDLRALIRLMHFIRSGRYQIVHTHSSKAGILGRWAAWLARTPVIVHTVHGWGHHDRQHPLVRRIYIALEKLSLRVTDRLIAVSPRNIEKGLRDGIGRRENYVTIRSGIELDRFGHSSVPRREILNALGIPDDVPVVGTVTRLSPQKAPLDFVCAASKVVERVPHARFVLVGDGPLRPEVEALAAELGMTERLVLTGLRRDVPELLGAFDIFALSSLWEGLPRALLQAMATGLPVVATNVDGNAEVVVDGISGCLVPAGDPKALAQAIVELVNDPHRASQMGKAGRNRVGEFGAWQMVDEISSLYLELLEQKGLA